jgi:hypothetical protein
MATKPSHKRVLMARRLAKRWVASKANPEFRLTVYRPAGRELRNLPDLLKSFRDGKIRLGGLDPIRDLGVKGGFDHCTVWSSDRARLITLDTWFQKVGCETTGVW